MTKESIYKEIRDAISNELDIPREEIQLESKLISDIGISSMELLNLMAILEKKFSIRISERQLRYFVTVQDIVDCIANSLEK